MSGEETGALILEQFRTISTKLDALPGLQAKIDLLDQSSREMGAELRTRDHAQQQAIEMLRKEIADLRMDQHKLMAAIAGVSSTTMELNSGMENLRKQVATVEGQVKSLFDTVLQTRRQMRELEEGFQGLEVKFCGLVSQEKFDELRAQARTLDDVVTNKRPSQEKFDELKEQVRVLDEEAEDNRPWLSGIRAFLRILLGLLGTAAAGGLLWLVAQAILGNL